METHRVNDMETVYLKLTTPTEWKLDCSEPCHFDFLLCPTQNCPHHATVQVFSIIHCPFMSEFFLCCGLDAHHWRSMTVFSLTFKVFRGLGFNRKYHHSPLIHTNRHLMSDYCVPSAVLHSGLTPANCNFIKLP